MVSPYAEFTVYNPRPGLRTAAEIKRQKTRRQEGAAFDAIFLLLRGHRESAPQEGGVVPGPALPARSRFGMQGAAASSRHTTAPWAVALHLLVSAARNFPPRRTPTPPPSLFSTRPWHPWLLLPGPATRSSRETLEQFRKVYVVLFGWSVISLLLE